MNRQAVGVLAAGFFTVSAAYAIRYGYGMLLPEMAGGLALSKTEAGVIYGAYFTAYTLFSPVVGRIADRGDARTILTLFTGLLAGGAFCMGYARSLMGASLFFTLAGIGHSACWTPVVALVQHWVPDHRRGAALAFTTLGSGCGIAVWSAALPRIVAASDWRAGWMSMGLYGMAVAGFNFLFVRNPPAPGGQTAGSDNPSDRYRDLLCQRRLWFIGFSYLLVGFTVLVPYTFLTSFAIEGLGLDYPLATSLITAVAVCGMGAKIVFGILSDSLGRIPVMMTCCLLLGAGCGVMAEFASPGVLFLGAGLFGLGFGAVWPVYAAAAPDFFAKGTAGSVIGLWTLFLGVGSVASPVVCGWTIDLSGSYVWAFRLGLGAGILAALLLLPVKWKRRSAAGTN